MPGGWLHRSCDSLVRSVFPSCWVSVGHFLRFFLCVFSSLRAVRHRCRRFRDLLLFFVCFLRRFGPHASQHGLASSPCDESALSTISNSTSSSSFTSSPSSVAISAETLSQAISQAFQQSLPQMLAAFRRTERQTLLPAARQAIPVRPLSRPACRRLIHPLPLL